MAAWVVNCPTSQNPEQVTKIIDQMQNRVRENEEVTSSLFVFHLRQYRKFGSESLLFQSLHIVWKQIFSHDFPLFFSTVFSNYLSS